MNPNKKTHHLTYDIELVVFTLSSIFLHLCVRSPHAAYINKCVETNKQERETTLRPTYCSQGTNGGPLSDKTTCHTKQLDNITIVIIAI